MSLPGISDRTSFDSRWEARVTDDRRRAVELLTSSQRRASETALARALVAGAGAVALTGSTVRGRRTAVSDLDMLIIGTRPDLSDVDEDLDLYVASPDAFWSGSLEVTTTFNGRCASAWSCTTTASAASIWRQRSTA